MKSSFEIFEDTENSQAGDHCGARIDMKRGIRSNALVDKSNEIAAASNDQV